MMERRRAKSRGRSRWRRFPGVLGLMLAVAVLSVGAVLLLTAEPAAPMIDPNPPRPSAQSATDSALFGEADGLPVAPILGPRALSLGPSGVTAPIPDAAVPGGVLPPPVLAPGMLSLGPLGVTAPILDATVPNGVLTPPFDVTQVGKWVDGAGLESDDGTVLIAGHVNMSGQGNGALFNLARMRPGEYVHTSDAQGVVTAWRVTSVVGRPKAAGIEESVLDGPDGPRRLAVVTCGGDLEFTDGVGDYEDNVYLYADRVVG